MAKKSNDSQKSPDTSGKGGSEKPPGRIKQIRMVAKLVHQKSPKSIPISVAIFLAVFGLAIAGGFLFGGGYSWLYWGPLGFMVAFLLGFIFFTRSASRVQYQMLDGQLGAGMAVLQNLRGDWSVDPGVNGNRSMDVIHRAVGRPGVVLVGEGDPTRLRSLIGAEKKRISRVAANTYIYDVQVGHGDGQVKIADLQKRMMKLPRNLDKTEVAELRYRLKALPPAMQMPKGPMPKGVKMPKGPKTQG